MTSTLRQGFTLVIVGALAVGCSGSSGESSVTGGGNDNNSTVVGTWNAVSVNGSPPPILLPTVRGCALTGLSGRLVTRGDGRFTANYSYRRQCPTIPEIVDRAIAGRYVINGANVVFAADSGFSKFTSAPLVTATVSGGNIVAQSTPSAGVTVTMTLRRQ